ncbi:MAG: hypothetical protein NTX24_00850 [Candidatus Pacearchaeota archaeon]|nr:hypothetical protein [Candidatus Pacearchaeota archaeon]
MSELLEREKQAYDRLTAVATTTFYRPGNESDTHRAILAINTIRKARDLGQLIIVVDGGSPEEILRQFERYGARVIMQPKGTTMGYGRRQAIEAAYNTGREIIVWTEPEKVPYIPEISKTAAPILVGLADFVVPRRRSLESYPTAQQFAEPLGNLCWEQITGKKLDVWFGPKTWRRDFSLSFRL